MEQEQKQSNKEKGYKYILSLLVKWGCNETVAKIIAGAIIGALVACGFLSSCTWSLNAVTPTQNFSSTIHIIPVENWKK